MRFKNFDLNLLVLLDEVFVEKNITRAAERLNMSQSAASSALARLRDYFADPLIVPVGRGMQLTARGEELVEPVRAFLVQAENTIETKSGFNPERSERRFVIYASDYVISTLLMSAISKIGQLAPNIRFDLRNLHESVVEGIRTGEVDLAIIPENFSVKTLPSKFLFEDEYKVVAWENNTQLKGSDLSLEQYLDTGHVVFSSSTSISNESVFMNLTNIHRQIDIFVESFSFIPRLVVGTNRLATVHSRLIEQWQESWPIRVFDLPFDCPGVREVVQWPETKKTDPAVEWLIGMLLQAVQSKS